MSVPFDQMLNGLGQPYIDTGSSSIANTLQGAGPISFLGNAPGLGGVTGDVSTSANAIPTLGGTGPTTSSSPSSWMNGIMSSLNGASSLINPLTMAGGATNLIPGSSSSWFGSLSLSQVVMVIIGVGAIIVALVMLGSKSNAENQQNASSILRIVKDNPELMA